ncbi:hypothetical protein HOY34_06775 [Xinfangfangia sp. D13-10-4-6]|uniref:hypothetical protein n=1 Tax=Pseudogemmobacter hezensis TaxID=2737662 RepID=UPI0015531712|nr:hypothetical protein [Pseudogemmobacter hezensis]NPD14911.1 hypothetical protein [Pseudogemmobacter hezensis]
MQKETHPLDLRGLKRGDAGSVQVLHDLVLAGLNRPDWVRPEAPDFFAPVLEEGLSLGLFAGDSLQGYALLQRRLEPGDDPGPKIGLAGKAFGKLCGCSVAPAWRGYGAQAQLSRARIALGRSNGLTRFFATAAPGNVASWLSLLRAGMSIATLGEKYGGSLRYTLVLTEGEAFGAGTWCDSHNLAEQSRLLDQGWRGTDAQDGRILFHRWRLI